MRLEVAKLFLLAVAGGLAGGLVPLACAARPVRALEVGSAPAPPSSSPAPSSPQTPSFGSVVIVFRTADGEELTLICGGEVSRSPERDFGDCAPGGILSRGAP